MGLIYLLSSKNIVTYLVSVSTTVDVKYNVPLVESSAKLKRANRPRWTNICN